MTERLTRTRAAHDRHHRLLAKPIVVIVVARRELAVCQRRLIALAGDTADCVTFGGRSWQRRKVPGEDLGARGEAERPACDLRGAAAESISEPASPYAAEEATVEDLEAAVRPCAIGVRSATHEPNVAPRRIRPCTGTKPHVMYIHKPQVDMIAMLRCPPSPCHRLRGLRLPRALPHHFGR